MPANGGQERRRRTPTNRRKRPLVPRYVAVTPPGLEPVLAEEVRERLAPSKLRSKSGAVILDFAGPPQEVAELRCAAEVWAYVREVEASVSGERSLRAWRAKLRRTELDRALRGLRRAGGSQTPETMRVSVTVAPDVNVRFIDVQDSAVQALGAASGLQAAGAEADVQVRVLVEPERTTVGILLPRSGALVPPSSPTSPLRPVAAAVLRLAAPAREETLLDLACGDGLLLSEWLAAGACGQYVGGDRNWRDVAAASALTKSADAPAYLTIWRSARVPLREASVDACLGLITRLPRRPQRTATALCSEVARLLRSAGRAALAAPRSLGLPAAMGKPPLEVQRGLRVRLGGSDLDLVLAQRGE